MKLGKILFRAHRNGPKRDGTSHPVKDTTAFSRGYAYTAGLATEPFLPRRKTPRKVATAAFLALPKQAR